MSSLLARVEAAPIGYPHGELLVAPSDLAAALELRGAVLVDARSSSAYRTAHLPGAIHLGFDLEADEPLIPLERIGRELALAGLTPEQEVILYDDGGGIRGTAPRLFWMLEVLGFEHVRILDGGVSAWRALGHHVTDKPSTRAPSRFTLRARPELAVSAETLEKKLKSAVIVDPRRDEEYNGWKLHGEARGGHVKGAIGLPLELFFDGRGAKPESKLAASETVRLLLERHGVTADQEIIIAGGDRSATLYFILRLLGFARVACFDGSMRTWAADPALPMELLPRYREVVYPEWVAALIEGRRPPEYDNKDFVIAEVSWGGPEVVYDKGHIPGAIHVNTDEIEADEKHVPRNWWNILPDEELVVAVEKMGITADTTVVVYGDRTTAAARLMWTLLYAGVKDVRLLNGGLKAWVRSGGQVEIKRNARRTVRAFGAKVPQHPEFRNTLDEVRARLEDKSFVLADVRSWDEFVGRATGYTYIHAKGRIPGARWARGGPNAYALEDYHDPDGTLVSYPEVLRMWQAEGIMPDKAVSFYCGTGWRASVAFLFARWMGFAKASVFDGGWLEWSEGPHAAEDPTQVGPAIKR